MSYLDSELSVQEGAPYYLVQFTRGSQAWRFTTRMLDTTYLTHTYSAEIITLGELRQNDEDSTMSLEIFLPRDNAFVAQFISASAPTPVAVTVFRNHRRESSTETKTVFLGQVSGIEFNQSQVAVHCTSLENAFVNPINRVAVQRTCPWMLYDDQCQAVLADHSYVGQLIDTFSNGLVLTVDSFTPNPVTADATFTNGFVVFGEQRRFVVDGVNGVLHATLTLQVPFNPGPVALDAITVVEGCAKTVAACRDQFNNVERFGGFALMPRRSPWDRLI